MSLLERCDRQLRSTTQPSGGAVGISLLTSIEEWGASQLLGVGGVLDQFDDRLSLFQSPEWFDHLCATEPTFHPYVVCVRDERDRLVGIVPLVPIRLYLDYSIKRVKFGKIPLSLLEISGGTPPFPNDEFVYDRVFKTIQEVARSYDGIYMRMVPTSSFWWRYCASRRSYVHHSTLGYRKGLASITPSNSQGLSRII